MFYLLEIDIHLKKSSNQIFSVINPVDDDFIDPNLITFIKYAVDKKDFDFVCNEIVNKAKIFLTPKQFGRLLNSNLDLLEQEGLHITKTRESDRRLYHVHYEEPTNDE